MAIKEHLEDLLQLKNQLAANLNTMGVTSHERENLKMLVPKVLLIPKTGSEKQVIFQSGSDVPDKYGDIIFTVFQEGIRDLNSHIQGGEYFCHTDNNYELSYNQEDFNWDAWLYTASITPVRFDVGTEILLTYKSGAAEEGFLCVIPTSGKSESDTVQNYIYTSLKNSNFTQIPFSWLQTEDYISVLISADNVNTGDYYLCWLGRSDNTRPMIRRVVVYQTF